jgi:predicted acyltransferase
MVRVAPSSERSVIAAGELATTAPVVDVTLSAIRWGSGASATSLRLWLYQTVFAPLASAINASLLYALCYTLLLYLVAYAMYRRNWFWRV